MNTIRSQVVIFLSTLALHSSFQIVANSFRSLNKGKFLSNLLPVSRTGGITTKYNNILLARQRIILFGSMDASGLSRPESISKDSTPKSGSDKTKRLLSLLRKKSSAATAEAQQDASLPDVPDQTHNNDFSKNPKRSRKRGNKAGKMTKQVEELEPPNSVVNVENMNVNNSGNNLLVNYFTRFRFEDLTISSSTKKAISEQMGYSLMTEVQHQTLPEILAGKDVLVKAKTGTGKTLAFLIPAIENLIKFTSSSSSTGRVLVLSPTRELAQQIGSEASTLCTHHNLGVILLVGGINMNSDLRALRAQPVQGNSDIIVATPGRLLAHLRDTPGVAEQMKDVKTLILDEADRLLDMGFKKDIDAISAYLNQPSPPSPPNTKKNNAGAASSAAARRNSNIPRQTLLFSATISNEIRQIANLVLMPGYKSIDTVGDEEEQTHSHVPQQLLTVPLDQTLPTIVQLVEDHIRMYSTTSSSSVPQLKNNLDDSDNNGYKIIMFFATARQTGYYANILNATGLNVLEIHSRKSQSHRTKTSEKFRVGKNMIMASSDVSARGLDYPDVTLVLQVGMTTREQYIHRLGRTARAGKGGHGVLLLVPYEQSPMLKELTELPLETISTEERSSLLHQARQSVRVQRAMSAVQQLADREREATQSDREDEEEQQQGGRKKGGGPVKGVSDIPFGEDSERDSAKMAWAAWLGYYNGLLRKLGWTKEELVRQSVLYANTMGFAQIPSLPAKTIGKMGLKGVAGLRIEKAGSGAVGRRGGGRNANSAGAPLLVTSTATVMSSEANNKKSPGKRSRSHSPATSSRFNNPKMAAASHGINAAADRAVSIPTTNSNGNQNSNTNSNSNRNSNKSFKNANNNNSSNNNRARNNNNNNNQNGNQQRPPSANRK